jgi:hypothetical protein
MEGLYSERSIKDVILVTEESSDCSMTESKRFCFTLSAWKVLLFLFGERGQRCVGEKILSYKWDRVRSLTSWRFPCIPWRPYYLKTLTDFKRIPVSYYSFGGYYLRAADTSSMLIEEKQLKAKS